MRNLVLIAVLSLTSQANAQETAGALGEMTANERWPDVLVLVVNSAHGDEAIVAANRVLASLESEALAACMRPEETGPWRFWLRLRRTGHVQRARFAPTQAQTQNAGAPAAECIRGVLEGLRVEGVGTRIDVDVVRGHPLSFGGPGASTVGVGMATPSLSPQIGGAAPVVRGSLSRHVIRAVINRHINEVRFCYEQALSSEPSLQGRLMMRFIIAPNGAVSSATAIEVPVGFEGIGRCVQGAFRRWTFPEPAGGGIVIVNYPFALTPG
ncbi:MAG: hypothetical protein ACI9KE_002550 [Polyangiales bacterium]|jgi:hypothetical protein